MSSDKKLIPNSFQTPNEIVDVMLPDLKGGELKVLMLLVRKTLGWHKDKDQVSITQFMKGTGLSNRSVIDSLASLREKNIILRDQTKVGDVYRLNMGWKPAEGGEESSPILGGEKSSPVKKVHRDGEKSSPISVKKVHTHKHKTHYTKPNNIVKFSDENLADESNLKKSQKKEKSDHRIKVFEQIWIRYHPNENYVVTNWKKWGTQIKSLLKAIEKVMKLPAYDKSVLAVLNLCRREYFYSSKRVYVNSCYDFDIFMRDINVFLKAVTEKPSEDIWEKKMRQVA